MWNHRILHPSRWSARQMILAALLGTLVAVAVAAVIAMSLAPPNIYFSIHDASLQNTTAVKNVTAIVKHDAPSQPNGTSTPGNDTATPGNGTATVDVYSFYNFTLVANNTGRRMEVHYSALTTEIWINARLWLPAEIDDPAGKLLGPAPTPQPPGGTSTVRGWAEFFGYDQTTKSVVTADEAETTWPNCTVVVEAKVWFTYGLARTRLYNIRVPCKGVNFLSKTSYADCTA